MGNPEAEPLPSSSVHKPCQFVMLFELNLDSEGWSASANWIKLIHLCGPFWSGLRKEAIAANLVRLK